MNSAVFNPFATPTWTLNSVPITSQPRCTGLRMEVILNQRTCCLKMENRTHLHLAASQGHSTIVRRLLDTDAANDDTCDSGLCSLFSASENGYTATEFLPAPAEPVEADAINADAKDWFHRTPLSLGVEETTKKWYNCY